MKLKEITNRSWLIVSDDNIRVGLISEKNSGGYLLLADRSKIEFSNQQELNKFFDVDVFGQIEFEEFDSPATDHYIGGYPVNHNHPIEIPSVDGLPLFVKRPQNGAAFAAGYYCIKIPRGWRNGFCPKLSTLQSYPYYGPMKTEIEMKQKLKSLRKTDKYIDDRN